MLGPIPNGKNVQAPRLVIRARIEGEAGRARAVLAWAPDKSSIILGRQYIMDAQTGKKIWELPDAADYQIKMIRPLELLIVRRDSSKLIIMSFCYYRNVIGWFK